MPATSKSAIPVTALRTLNVALIIFLTAISCHATPLGSVAQTQNRLKQLDTEISQLKAALAHAQDKRGLLNQELAGNEKQIGMGIQKLHFLMKDMNLKRQTIQNLQHRVTELNQQLLTQQKLLAEHVVIRYKMGEYQPIKLILNQDAPYSVSRLLTFHQYLVQSRQDLIDEIDRTRNYLTVNQETLVKEMENQKMIEAQLHTNQELLKHNKEYHREVIKSLNNYIQGKELILSEFERNKKNLSDLLKKLASQTIIHSTRAFASMRHKLPKPVRIAHLRAQKTNQGVTFHAKEGTPVHAVHNGKIVFSDWLNGYGLLLIIDHGHGFMTLYAHNQSLFKHTGATVVAGEHIAAVGHSGGIRQNGLYFEVREHGKAVSPRQWLS